MNEFALQSSTRAPLAPRISFGVPTSGEPEHSTPRKLACALPFSIDNPMQMHWWRCSSAHTGVCAFVTLSRMNEFALQSSTRAPHAPQISFDVPTSGEPEHSTPRKLACALPFSVDNPDANAKWWRCSSAHTGVCAFEFYDENEYTLTYDSDHDSDYEEDYYGPLLQDASAWYT